jgi:predicted lipoprotein with Yx(FWY)xxD motif
MSKAMKVLFPMLLCSLIIAVPPLWALWIDDGVPLCTATGDQNYPYIISNGAGGAIITWIDIRNEDSDIYVQQIDASGTIQWTIDGVPLCTATNFQYDPRIISDGAGGAIVTWQDPRSGGASDIYAQRINTSGTVQWTADGVPLCMAANFQKNPQVTSDGTGGAIVAWYDYRNDNYDIYVQRISALGTIQWTADGVPLCTATGTQWYPQVTSDGVGGAIVTWQDERSENYDIYAQRINASGIVQWTADGVPLCTAAGEQSSPQVASDGTGGAIVTWQDYRNDNYDIYSQRINISGTVQWASDGVPLCTATGGQASPQVTSDGAGGAIITWYDARSGAYDLYAQCINTSGTVQWTADGAPLCMVTGAQMHPRITSDGAGGAVVTWVESRNGNCDIYAQRINTSGTVLWTSDGVPISVATGTQYYPQITSDGAGGAIVTWQDERSGNDDIYAQQIDSQGRTGYLLPTIHSVNDVPGDEGGCVNLTWDAPRLDYLSGTITEYTVWRALATTSAISMLSSGAVIVSSPAAALEATPADRGKPILRLAPINGESFYWKLISSFTAYHLQGYSEIVPTLFDSTAVCSDYHYFQVIAHTSDPLVYYVSDPDSGYSVDNLSPCPPLAFTGEQLYTPEGLALTWEPGSEPDLGCYRIYRGTDESFMPGAGNLLIELENAEYFDDTWTWEAGYYYKLSAVDIHGNESGFALLGPGVVTGDDPIATPTATYLAQNYPNPFNPITNIGFGIKESGHVSLRIYDAAGRLVATLIDEALPAGHYDEQWDGLRDNGSKAASGVYFYRLTARTFIETKKMILLK